MKKSVFIGAGLLALALSSQAAELFVNIHSSQAMAQGAGLVLAGQAAAQKATVRVLLCDAAGDIAVVGKELPKLKPKDVTTQQMLQGLIKSGVKVEVCALYLPKRHGFGRCTGMVMWRCCSACLHPSVVL